METTTEIKELVLDYSKWRCGQEGPNKVGEGHTQMRNSQGFTCCLGQFATQLVENVDEKDILDTGTPGGLSYHIGKEIPLLSVIKTGVSYPFDNTELATAAITINDNTDTTPEQKIEELQQLFGKEGISIKVINKP